MSINKLALIRYKTIDECLQNRFRKWTLEDLIEKVSEALYEHEGIKTGVSKRTIQADIQLMRSDKLGYNAPIIVKDKKYYAYEDKNYSISKVPINQADVQKIKNVLDILKQFEGFQYFDEMIELIAKLENNLYKSTKKTKNCIQFENNKKLKGIEYLHNLYQAIIHKKTLWIEYKSFRAKKSQYLMVYPCLLKEYRNRWFLIVKVKNKQSLMTLALDRIIGFQELPQEEYQDCIDIDFDTYYQDVIGVTKSEKDKPSKIILSVTPEHAPYILTKPFHDSQTILKQDDNELIISIEVVLNFELEKEILSWGEGVKVLAPRLLVKKMEYRIERLFTLYQNKKK